MLWITRIAFVLLLIPLNCRADIDSLNTALRNSDSIPEQIDILLLLGEELSYSDTDAALKCFEQSFDLLKEHDFPEKYAWTLNYNGYTLMLVGRFEEARVSLLKGVEISKKLNKPKLTSRCLIDIATTYYYEAKIQKALSYCEKGLYYLKGLPKNKAIIYNNMGIFSKYAGDFEKANDYYISALKCFEKIKDTALMISAQNNIASLYNHIRFYDRALNYHNQALELCNKTNDQEGLARACNGLALVQDNIGLDNQCVVNNKKAIRIFKELGLTKELLSTRYNLADFYYSHKRYPEALTIFKSVRTKFEEINAVSEYAITTSAIGLIYYQQKNFEKAKYFLEEAYELQKHIENPSMYKSMLLNLSKLYESI
ncbi:MAG: tetratricopeptide repeat protein, partial [Crocinitomicaceae bacterium]|nr:tetratricopeptide repeat protein [Crocinitomicaceae bacterium]